MDKLSREEKKAAAIKLIEKIAEQWDSEIVLRSQVKKFTQGAYSSGYLANCDSAHTGPEGGFFIGPKKCYPTDSFLKWMLDRVEV
jgi:hypothetical protein